MKAPVTLIREILEYYQAETDDFEQFMFAKSFEDNAPITGSVAYPLLFLHTAMFFTATRNGLYDLQFTVELVNTSAFNTDPVQREANIASLQEKAIRLTRYLQEFDYINSQRSISTDVQNLRVTNEPAITVILDTANGDITDVALIDFTIQLQVNPNISYCEILWTPPTP